MKNVEYQTRQLIREIKRSNVYNLSLIHIFIEAVGVEFNPDFHNAVMQAPSEEYESGIITQELQRGYLYKDKVVRHSMVMVAE